MCISFPVRPSVESARQSQSVTRRSREWKNQGSPPGSRSNSSLQSGVLDGCWCCRRRPSPSPVRCILSACHDVKRPWNVERRKWENEKEGDCEWWREGEREGREGEKWHWQDRVLGLGNREKSSRASRPSAVLWIRSIKDTCARAALNPRVLVLGARFSCNSKFERTEEEERGGMLIVCCGIQSGYGGISARARSRGMYDAQIHWLRSLDRVSVHGEAAIINGWGYTCLLILTVAVSVCKCRAVLSVVEWSNRATAAVVGNPQPPLKSVIHALDHKAAKCRRGRANPNSKESLKQLTFQPTYQSTNQPID